VADLVKVDVGRFERIILGIDYGLAESGWGAVGWEFPGSPPYVIAYGVCRTRAGGDPWDRTDAMVDQLREVEEVTKATEVAMEDWGHRSAGKATTSHLMGLVIGGLLRGLHHRPRSVGITGEWHATLGLPYKGDKVDVATWVREGLRLDHTPKPDHASDALSIALAAFSLPQLQR